LTPEHDTSEVSDLSYLPVHGQVKGGPDLWLDKSHVDTTRYRFLVISSNTIPNSRVIMDQSE